ncbi:hypothetical protein KR215_008721 [Drosophila sulfurigaster]|nr:hypothetical protein KR215_008721 [Drosophila sulfurigaster]
MSATKLISLCLVLILLCEIGLSKGLENEKQTEASLPSYWQRLKASITDFKWQQKKPEPETAEATQRRRQLWERIKMSTLL